MRFSQIVGQPGRFVLHQAGVFKGEGWLLDFRMWKVHEKKGMVQCTVDLGDGQTYIWIAADGLDTEELTTPEIHTFLVGTEKIMTDRGPMPSLKLIAFDWYDKWVMCREQPRD